MLKAEPGLTEVVSHCINTGDAPPVRSMAYQIPGKWKEKVREEIEELKQMGILVPSYSTWSSPIVPVAKPDGSVRVCVDFRRVNKLTVQDQYHIPLVAEIVDKVGNAGCLSKLDLNKGFYQVKMSEEDRAKTALVTAFGKYEFSRMPFGLVNATSTFQRLMDRVLEGMHDLCAAYVDDILIFSKDFEEHLSHIDQVMQKLKGAGLTAKPSKCEWAKEELVYLGHKIGKGEAKCS